MPDVTLSEVARRLDVSPATLRRWVADGIVPLRRRRAGRRPRSPTRASSRGCASAGTARRRSATRPRSGPARLRLSRGPVPAGRGPRTRSSEAAEETGLEPALIERIWTAARASRRARWSPSPTTTSQLLQLRRRRARRRLPARRLPAARARLRPGAGPDRRRRGQAVPPLRARAADARRRARPRDGRGDGGPRARAAAARLADHGPRAPALPPALRRAGRGRPHGGATRRRRSSSAACGWRSRSPTSPATRG